MFVYVWMKQDGSRCIDVDIMHAIDR